MPQFAADWSAPGIGSQGHGPGGAFDGINQTNVEKAVNAIAHKGVATVVAATPQSGIYNQPAGGSNAIGATFTYSAPGVTVIDGHTLAAFDTVLLAAQALPAQNGLYGVTTPGTSSVATLLTRLPVMNSSADLPGAEVIVNGGAQFVATKWVCTATGTPVMGTDPLNFRQPALKKRVLTQSNPASPLALNTDTFDVFKVTGLTAALQITAASGNPVDRDEMHLTVNDGGTSVALTWGTKFGAFGALTLPTATPAGKRLTADFVWDADASKWILYRVDATGY